MEDNCKCEILEKLIATNWSYYQCPKCGESYFSSGMSKVIDMTHLGSEEERKKNKTLRPFERNKRVIILNPSSLNIKQIKEKYAKALAKHLKEKGFNKIEYTELGEGLRDVLINNSEGIETLSEEDLDTIDILMQTLYSLKTEMIENESSVSIMFEGIEIIVRSS